MRPAASANGRSNALLNFTDFGMLLGIAGRLQRSNCFVGRDGAATPIIGVPCEASIPCSGYLCRLPSALRPSVPPGK